MPRTQRQLRAEPFTTLAKINHSSRSRHPRLRCKLEQRSGSGARGRRRIPSCSWIGSRSSGTPEALPSPDRPGLRGAARHQPLGGFFPASSVMRVLVGSFPCPLSQEPVSHPEHPSLSSARSGAAVSRCGRERGSADHEPGLSRALPPSTTRGHG